MDDVEDPHTGHFKKAHVLDDQDGCLRCESCNVLLLVIFCVQYTCHSRSTNLDMNFQRSPKFSFIKKVRRGERPNVHSDVSTGDIR